MKIGLKLLPDDFSYMKDFKKNTDFLELWAVQGKKYDYLTKLKDHDLYIHSEDFKFHINYGNPADLKNSRESLKFAFSILKKYKAKYIIVHPGIQFNNKCSSTHFEEVVHGFDKKKILIENQPPFKSRTYPQYCRNYDELRLFMKMHGVGFCLDVCHAAASAHYFKKDPYEFIEELLELKPKHLHFSNLMADTQQDQHKHLLDGFLDFGKLMEILPKDLPISLETPLNVEKNKEEIKLLRSFEK